MNREFFSEYKFEEHQIANLISGKLISKDHLLQSPRDLYPEYDISDSLAFHRPGVNIGALLFLYRQVMVYVPQIPRAAFPKRYGLSYETFVELCKPLETGVPPFILPILNHPKYYNNKQLKSDLKELIELKPPTWERWHKVLEITGGDRWFDLADEVLNYKKLYAFPDYRKQWKLKLNSTNESRVSREMKQQIKNNFTNLCLIGLEDKALEIADLSKKHPDLAINDLMYTSEIFAYPKIMGANGYANILSKARSTIQSEEENFRIKTLLSKKGVDADVIKAIADGIEFNNIPKLFGIEFLLKWHQQKWSQYAKDFYGRLLEELKQDNPDENEVYTNVKEVLQLLKSFTEMTKIDEKKISKQIEDRNRTRSVVTFGLSTLFGIGGLFGNSLLSFFASTASGLIGVSNPNQRLKVLKSMFQSHYKTDLNPDLIDRYIRLKGHVKNEIDGYLDLKGLKDVNSTDNVARNIWTG